MASPSLAREVAADGIRVNCVCPGSAAPPCRNASRLGAKMRGMRPEEVLEDYVGQTPLGRSRSRRKWRRQCLFLASDLAGFVTGEALNISAACGWTEEQSSCRASHAPSCRISSGRLLVDDPDAAPVDPARQLHRQLTPTDPPRSDGRVHELRRHLRALPVHDVVRKQPPVALAATAISLRSRRSSPMPSPVQHGRDELRLACSAARCCRRSCGSAAVRHVPRHGTHAEPGGARHRAH